jgi:signal recognition particle GTPase
MDYNYLREKWTEAILSIEEFKDHLVQKNKETEDPKRKEQLRKQIEDANDNIAKLKEKLKNARKRNANESIANPLIEKYLITEDANEVDIENFIYDLLKKKKNLEKDDIYKAAKSKLKRFDPDDFEEAYDAVVGG